LGLIEPFKGTVRVYGEPPEQGRKYIGYVPQYAKFDEQYPISVKQVVLMGRRSKKGLTPWYSAEDKEKMWEALRVVEMEKYAERQISELSGGQKQRVFIARALAGEPEVLLLDEPTASVDQNLKKSIYNLLQELNKDMTILLVTHDVGVISAYETKLACINKHYRVIAHRDSDREGERETHD